MSKRNIAYIKPDEPAFLKRLKQSIGYKEGTTVETKFETLPDGPENLSDNESEEPQVVVLAPGDLTKEEAENLKKNIDLENENKPADLSQRIVFKSKKKTENEENPKKRQRDTDNESQSKKKTVNPPKLSFDVDVDDEDSDER